MTRPIDKDERPKILFATADVPWQAASGGKLRDLGIHRAAGAAGDLTLACFPIWTQPDATTPLNGVHVFPAPWPRSPLRRAGIRVAATVRRRQVFQEYLASIGAIDRLVEVTRACQPDVVILGQPLFDGFLPAIRPLAPRLIVDLWQLRATGARQRLTTAPGWGRRARALLDLLVLEHVDREVARYADEVWMVEPTEARIYQERHGARVRVVPNTVSVDRYARYQSIPRASGSFCFIGILYFDPNVTAAIRLATRILPLVRRQRPDARLVVAGRNPPASLRALIESTPGATLLPDVEDAIEIVATYGPLVAPLEAGTGTRLKILEAASARVPVITTALGLAGLQFQPGRDVLVAETDEEFADALLHLWEDEDRQKHLTDSAYEQVRSRYDTSVLDGIVARAVRNEPEPHDPV